MLSLERIRAAFSMAQCGEMICRAPTTAMKSCAGP